MKHMAKWSLKELETPYVPQMTFIKSWWKIHVYFNNSWYQLHNENPKHGDVHHVYTKTFPHDA